MRYADSQRDRYPGGVFWFEEGKIDADVENAIVEALRKSELRGKPAAEQQLVLREELLRLNCDGKPWLVVVDNVDEEATVDKLGEVLGGALTTSTAATSHLLLTSRLFSGKLQDKLPQITVLPVCSLRPEDAAAMLLLRTNARTRVVGEAPAVTPEEARRAADLLIKIASCGGATGGVGGGGGDGGNKTPSDDLAEARRLLSRIIPAPVKDEDWVSLEALAVADIVGKLGFWENVPDGHCRQVKAPGVR